MRWDLATVEIWKMLRRLARNKNQPMTGRELRVGMSRRSRYGGLHDYLVQQNLLQVVKRARPLPENPGGARPEPPQFRTTYKLTENGLHAAEYGEYERPAPRKLPNRDRAATKAKPKPKKKAARAPQPRWVGVVRGGMNGR